MRFDPCDLILVRPHAVEIGPIWSCEQIARLEKVHMRVDVAGKNKFLVAFNPLRSDRHAARFAAGNALNFVAVNHNNGVFDRFAIRRIDCGAADERDFLSKGRSRLKTSDKQSEKRQSSPRRDGETSI